jgi:trk system potassium uptake protein TrkA
MALTFKGEGLNVNIIVVGCGRVGSRIATLFSEDGHSVVVIDADPASFRGLGRSFDGRTIVGMGFDEDVLQVAGIEECDVLVSVTNEDNANLMISEVGSKLFNVTHVLTRLDNPDRETAYLQLGIDYVCGTTLVAEEIYSKVIATHSGHVDTFGDFELLRFALNLSNEEDRESILVGNLERDHEIRIVAFERFDSNDSSIPTKDSVLYHGDIVLACVRKDQLKTFRRYFVS